MNKINSLTCIVCGDISTKFCRKCKARYCGKNCQTIDWPNHKIKCCRHSIPLIAAEAPLIAAEAPLIATKAPLTATKAPLTAAEASLTAAEAPLIAAEASLIAADTPLTAIKAPLQFPKDILEFLNENGFKVCKYENIMCVGSIYNKKEHECGAYKCMGCGIHYVENIHPNGDVIGYIQHNVKKIFTLHQFEYKKGLHAIEKKIIQEIENASTDIKLLKKKLEFVALSIKVVKTIEQALTQKENPTIKELFEYYLLNVIA